MYRGLFGPLLLHETQQQSSISRSHNPSRALDSCQEAALAIGIQPYVSRTVSVGRYQVGTLIGGSYDAYMNYPPVNYP